DEDSALHQRHGVRAGHVVRRAAAEAEAERLERLTVKHLGDRVGGHAGRVSRREHRPDSFPGSRTPAPTRPRPFVWARGPTAPAPRDAVARRATVPTFLEAICISTPINLSSRSSRRGSQPSATLFNYPAKLEQLRSLEGRMAEADFWNNQDAARKTVAQMK